MARHTALAQAVVASLVLVSASHAFEVYTVWPYDSAEARRRQQETAASLQLPVEFSIDLGGGVPLVFELIPAGRSRLGSPPDEPGYEGDEALRFVTFQTPFYMCKYQLTRAQYKAVTGAYPNECEREDTSGGGGGDYPALVIYDDIDPYFLPWVNPLLPEGMVARFPTADEWEHACRAGTEATWYSGGDEAALSRIGWYRGNSGDVIHPVGRKGANPWGLCDMVGNVWTWVYLRPVDPYTPHFVKGGSYNSEAFGNGCRTGNLQMMQRFEGLRLVASLPTVPVRVDMSLLRSAPVPRSAMDIAGTAVLDLSGRCAGVAGPSGLRFPALRPGVYVTGRSDRAGTPHSRILQCAPR